MALFKRRKIAEEEAEVSFDYCEQFVERKKGKADRILAWFALAVLMAFIILGTLYIGGFATVIAIFIAVILYFAVFMRLNVVYHYVLENRYLTVEAIYHGWRHKKLLKFQVERAIIVAPKNSNKLNDEKPNVFHVFTSEDPDVIPYAIIYYDEIDKVCILADLNEDMIGYLKRCIGWKVFD